MNHCMDFNQIWHEASLGKDNHILYKWSWSYPWGLRGGAQKGKIGTCFKSLLLMYRCMDFNHIWHGASFREDNHILYKWKWSHPWGLRGEAQKGEIVTFALKAYSSWTTVWISTIFGMKHRWGKTIIFCINEAGPTPEAKGPGPEKGKL